MNALKLTRELDPVETAQRLVRCASLTADSNADIARVMADLLLGLDFEVNSLEYLDSRGTKKIAIEAKRAPRASGSSQDSGDQSAVAYFCHNDVVSVQGWDCAHGGPFDGEIAEQRLWGRGACDMKGSAAAALAAISTLDVKQQCEPIFYFVTGDEECGMVGADVLVQQSRFYREAVEHQAYSIIGEPTQLSLVNAHKGGCHLDVSASGVAAHSSTAEGLNANWQLIPFLGELRQLAQRCETEPSLLNEDFAPSSVSLNAVLENYPAASNITVGRAVCRIFFRPMPGMDWMSIRDSIIGIAEQHGLNANCLRPLPPLHTSEDTRFVQSGLALLSQSKPEAVCYATDGCCFGELENLIVLGPGSIEQAHRPDEWIALSQLQSGTEVFAKFFRQSAFRM